ncbi:MAG: hypothetical protein ABW096_14005 [Candidatus Thiodiazotropha sp.]
MKFLTFIIYIALFTTAYSAEIPDSHPPMDHSTIFQHADQTTADVESMRQAEVVEVINTTGYTYIEIIQDDKPVWIAVPTTVVEVGDTVHYADSLPVENHSSQSLNRTFESVIFLNKVVINSDK